MPSIYLHIGIEKTGSTSIQDFLLDFRESIFSGCKVYPDGLFRFQNQMELSSIVLDRNLLVNMEVPDSIEIFEINLLRFLNDNRGNDVYFSSEHLSSRVTEAFEIAKFMSIIKSFGHRVVIVAFYREPRSWIYSHYKQYVSSGGWLRFDQYLSASFGAGLIARTTNFGRSLLNWKHSLSGEDEFIPLDFDLLKKDLIYSYCSAVGLDISNLKSERMIGSNVSLSDWQVGILRLINWVFRTKSVTKFSRKLLALVDFELNFFLLKCDDSLLQEYVRIQNSYIEVLVDDLNILSK